MAEGAVVTVHARYLRMFRRARWYVLAWACLSVVFLVAGAVAGLASSNHATTDHSARLAASLALAVPFSAASLFVVERRIGYYARPGEVGFIGVFRLRPFRQPIVRFHRFTATNGRWVLVTGRRDLTTVPIVVGLTEGGRRSVTLTPVLFSEDEIDRFLSETGLPVDGDWSERIPRLAIGKRWPNSPDTRRQTWAAAVLTLPGMLIVVAALVVSFVLVR